jgi:hypothetical protein
MRFGPGVAVEFNLRFGIFSQLELLNALLQAQLAVLLDS